ncbi:MAG: M23 family metallopeptidase [Oscillospiraceae bacterium]|nr:M23 family metallopeptidase [Oscillospiraceae bacterium]
MNSKGSGGRLEGLFTGKGFYIVLFLCAAVIGVSAWMLAAGDKTVDGELSPVSQNEGHRVETVLLPPDQDMLPVLKEDTEGLAPVIREDTEQTEPVQEVFGEETETVDPRYLWPVSGVVARFHDPDHLVYDETMRDWRTHEGIDILAPLGEVVTAAHAGVVESIARDDLMGVIVTVSHGDGVCTVYAGLAEGPAVAVGDRVEPGTAIGAIGTTALCEVGQEPHLHFAVQVYGVDKDPLDYLPA